MQCDSRCALPPLKVLLRSDKQAFGALVQALLDVGFELIDLDQFNQFPYGPIMCGKMPQADREMAAAVLLRTRRCAEWPGANRTDFHAGEDKQNDDAKN